MSLWQSEHLQWTKSACTLGQKACNIFYPQVQTFVCILQNSCTLHSFTKSFRPQLSLNKVCFSVISQMVQMVHFPFKCRTHLLWSAFFGHLEEVLVKVWLTPTTNFSDTPWAVCFFIGARQWGLDFTGLSVCGSSYWLMLVLVWGILRYFLAFFCWNCCSHFCNEKEWIERKGRR